MQVFTPEELATYDGRQRRQLYLAVLGEVYDVSAPGGRKQYGAAHLRCLFGRDCKIGRDCETRNTYLEILFSDQSTLAAAARDHMAIKLNDAFVLLGRFIHVDPAFRDLVGPQCCKVYIWS